VSSGTDGFYRPPESNLDQAVSGAPNFGSVDRALRGEFEFEIGEVVAEAWLLLRGSKRVILGGLIVYSLIQAAIVMMNERLFGEMEGAASLPYRALELIPTAIASPILAGIVIFAIKRSVSDPSASFSDVFDQFDRFVTIAGVALLQSTLVFIGSLFLLLPGLYLQVAYMHAIPLAAEKGMGVWEALETSRRALTHCWFRLFFLMLLLAMFAVFGGVLTLGIGLLWIVPLGVLCQAVVYRNVFGFEPVRDRIEAATHTGRHGEFTFDRHD